MSNTGVYMNSTTQKIKSKGYSLPEFLKSVGFSLSSYRRYEKQDNDCHAMLNRLIDELESK
jgi:hypothetical protein